MFVMRRDADNDGFLMFGMKSAVDKMRPEDKPRPVEDRVVPVQNSTRDISEPRQLDK
jgi:hypothetical protein